MATKLSGILTWTKYFATHKLSPKNPEMVEHTFQVNPTLNEKVSLWKGDITTIAADAIVNAANSSLLGGGGVDGAIHRAAGKQLFEECAALNGCKVGEAKLTKGYKLPAKYIIHTVGTMKQDPVELAYSYKNSLTLMLRHSLRSIVFPCISTGVYGYDNENAAHVAIYEARCFLTKHYDNVDRIVFCVYSDEDLKIYQDLLQRYFPVVEHPDANFSLDDVKSYIEANPQEKERFEKLMRPATLKAIPFESLKKGAKV